jgi:hypothetical protein
VATASSPSSLTAHVTCRSHMLGQEHMLRVQVEPMEVQHLNILLDSQAPPSAYATL